MPMSWWHTIEIYLDLPDGLPAPGDEPPLFLHNANGACYALKPRQVTRLLSVLTVLDAPPFLDWGGYGGGQDVSTRTLYVKRNGKQVRHSAAGSFDDFNVEYVWMHLDSLLDDAQLRSYPLQLKLTQSVEPPPFETSSELNAGSVSKPQVRPEIRLNESRFHHFPQRISPEWFGNKASWALIFTVVVIVLLIGLYLVNS